jgi:putative PIN family toxin of toxin-antitoxin system
VTRVVLDANVLVSGIVGFIAGADRPPAQALAAWRAGRFELLLSDDILAEVQRPLEKPYFTARLTREQRGRVVALLQTEATITPLTVDVHGVATHPEDDLILAAAVSAGADYLVTGDTQLQRLGNYQGVRIVFPRTFVDVLQEQAHG